MKSSSYRLNWLIVRIYVELLTTMMLYVVYLLLLQHSLTSANKLSSPLAALQVDTGGESRLHFQHHPLYERDPIHGGLRASKLFNINTHKGPHRLLQLLPTVTDSNGVTTIIENLVLENVIEQDDDKFLTSDLGIRVNKDRPTRQTLSLAKSFLQNAKRAYTGVKLETSEVTYKSGHLGRQSEIEEEDYGRSNHSQKLGLQSESDRSKLILPRDYAEPEPSRWYPTKPINHRPTQQLLADNISTKFSHLLVVCNAD